MCVCVWEQEGRDVTASVEELHVKLQQVAQGLSASRGSRNSKQGNLREAQVRSDLRSALTLGGNLLRSAVTLVGNLLRSAVTLIRLEP